MLRTHSINILSPFPEWDSEPLTYRRRYVPSRFSLSYTFVKRRSVWVSPTTVKKKKERVCVPFSFSQGVGFEPTWGCPQTVFKTASL